MNTLVKCLLALLFICQFSACSSDDITTPEIPEIPETINILKLSVSGILYTDDVDYTFNIEDGNGGYKVEVSDNENAKARIEGNKVIVELLSNSPVLVTVSDKKEQTATVSVTSYSKSLVSSGYGIFMAKDDISKMELGFGAGGYTIELLKGTSANAVIEDDKVKVTALEHGNSYFLVTDKRGSTARFEANIVAFYDLTSDKLSVGAVNDQIISIKLLQGTGWQISAIGSSGCIENVYMMPKGDIDKKYDILQINTTKDETKKGIGTVKIKDKDGNTADITIVVQ